MILTKMTIINVAIITIIITADQWAQKTCQINKDVVAKYEKHYSREKAHV